MKFYRLEKLDEYGVSFGFEFATTRRAAQRLARESADEAGREVPVEPEEINIKPTKAGILAALRRYASHADNG